MCNPDHEDTVDISVEPPKYMMSGAEQLKPFFTARPENEQPKPMFKMVF